MRMLRGMTVFYVKPSTPVKKCRLTPISPVGQGARGAEIDGAQGPGAAIRVAEFHAKNRGFSQ